MDNTSPDVNGRMMTESFVLYSEQWPAISLLNDAQRSCLMQAIFALHGACEMPELDDITKAIFLLMKPRFESNREKYEQKCEQNRENGKKGGRPRKNENQTVTTENPNENQKTKRFLDQNRKTLLDTDSDTEEKTSPPVESLVNQDRARVREEPQGRGEASPFPDTEPEGREEPDQPREAAALPTPVDLSGPGMEFLELREFYSREIRTEGPLDGFDEYKQLKAARDPTGTSVFPGLSRILDDLAARKAAGIWNPGYEIGLARYLKTRTWLAPIQSRASPSQAKSWLEREDEANFNAFMAEAKAKQEARERGEA